MRFCLITFVAIVIAPTLALSESVPLTPAIVAPADPLAYRSLTLDAQVSAEDYFAGRDPVMDAALKLAHVKN